MLKRKAADRLEAWFANDERKALLVSGARQVGKTYLIDSFVAERFENVAKFDLVEDTSIQASFSQATSAEDLYLRISLAARVPLVPGKTVVFIDEVQKAPEIMTFVKYLVKDTDLRYVLSGSLLGIELENIRSQPVGYVREVEMFPLDFEEFCWANGTNSQAFDILSASLAKREAVPGFLHDQLLALYHRYLIVGGMPAAVSAFVEGRGIDAVRSEQADIHAFYRRDIMQYAPKGQRLVIQNIYDLIPSEISARTKRFKFGSIPDVKKFKQVDQEFLWLTKAGVAIPVFDVAAPTQPLLASEQHNRFKLFYLDVGMLTSTYFKTETLGLLDGDTRANLGGVYENAVAQQFLCHGFKPYYFTSKKVGELDFLLERADGSIIAIEVKSGSNYKTHAAIDNALAVRDYHIDEAIVLAETNVEARGGITYLPIYSACLLMP